MSLVGLFVGGRAQRFGGARKGLLVAPDSGEPLVTRTARIARTTLGGEVVLVGNAEGYESLGFSVVADAPAGIGPLGGLSALLEAALDAGGPAFAIAGDMPRVDGTLLSRLAAHAPMAAAVAPRADDRWQPLFARYDPTRCRPVVDSLVQARRHALSAVLDALGADAAVLPVDDAEASALDDWDRPEDLQRS